MSSGEKTERSLSASRRETPAPSQGRRETSQANIEERNITERKKESLFKNSPRLFRNLLDGRRNSEEKGRGGSSLEPEEIHHLVNNCEESQNTPGASAVTITHNSSCRIVVNNCEDITGKSDGNESQTAKLKTEPLRKNTLSSGEVTVIVHHDFHLDQDLDFFGIKRPNHKTVTNIFRFL